MKKKKTSIYQPPKHIGNGYNCMVNNISSDPNIVKANHQQYHQQVTLSHKTKK